MLNITAQRAKEISERARKDNYNNFIEELWDLIGQTTREGRTVITSGHFVLECNMVTYIKKGKNYLPIDPTPIAEVIKIFTGYGFTVALANYNLIDSSAWMVIRWK